MSEGLTLVIFVAVLLAAGFMVAAWKAYRWKLLFLVLMWTCWLVIWQPIRLLGFGIGKLAFSGNGSKVGDPVADELVKHKKVDPANVEGISVLRHGEHVCAGGKVKAVHKLVAGMTGSGKNQADLNHEIEAQLKYSDEHMILLDAKSNAELSKIVFAEAGPNDRIFYITFHSADPHSSSLRIARTEDEAADVAYNL